MRESSAPEGLWVQAGVVRQQGVQSVLQHQQTAVGFLLHGEEETNSSVQSSYRKETYIFLKWVWWTWM